MNIKDKLKAASKVVEQEEQIAVNHEEISESPIELPQPKKIKVDYSKIHYRGVFATEDIESQELIERCPLVILDFRTKYHKDKKIFDYLYTNKCPCKDCENHGALFLMVMGYGMIYNHQDTPNTRWVFQIKDRIADVIAERPIKKGEEIFVSYGDSYFNGRNKLTIEGNEIKSEGNLMPPEWSKWVKENIERGVDTQKIKEILVSNNFDSKTIEAVISEVIGGSI
jgi:hypothetical protein